MAPEGNRPHSRLAPALPENSGSHRNSRPKTITPDLAQMLACGTAYVGTLQVSTLRLGPGPRGEGLGAKFHYAASFAHLGWAGLLRTA